MKIKMTILNLITPNKRIFPNSIRTVYIDQISTLLGTLATEGHRGLAVEFSLLVAAITHTPVPGLQHIVPLGTCTVILTYIDGLDGITLVLERS